MISNELQGDGGQVFASRLSRFTRFCFAVCEILYSRICNALSFAYIAAKIALPLRVPSNPRLASRPLCMNKKLKMCMSALSRLKGR